MQAKFDDGRDGLWREIGQKVIANKSIRAVRCHVLLTGGKWLCWTALVKPYLSQGCVGDSKVSAF